MNWDKEAEELLARAPLFVRPLARRKIEQFARARSTSCVTADIARQAYQAMRGAPAGEPPASHSDQLPPAEMIERLESETEELARHPAFRTRHYQVRPCSGAVGCPRSLIPVREVAEAVARRIADSGFPDYLERGMAGRPILSHHRFQAAVSGCPNACSQPQIQDFGVIGAAAINISPDLCDGCLRCVKACREGAMRVNDRTPAINGGLCIECGDCARACPTEALTLGAAGYRILAGGRLGRHPRLASEVARVAGPGEVVEVLARALRALMEKGKPGERLAALIERAGPGALDGALGTDAREAERKHGSAAGRYQEIEGPPIARRIMQDLALDDATLEHACRIIGSHHSARGIDTLEFRIIWDADWLVNLPDEFAGRGPQQLAAAIDRIFRTAAGRRRAGELYGAGCAERGTA